MKRIASVSTLVVLLICFGVGLAAHSTAIENNELDDVREAIIRDLIPHDGTIGVGIAAAPQNGFVKALRAVVHLPAQETIYLDPDPVFINRFRDLPVSIVGAYSNADVTYYAGYPHRLSDAKYSASAAWVNSGLRGSEYRYIIERKGDGWEVTQITQN